MTYFLEFIGGLLFAVALLLNVSATVALVRTKQLTIAQKTIQGFIVWILPFIGARLITQLLAESEPGITGQRWIPNDTINLYVWQALGIEAQTANRTVETEIEQTVIHSVTEHFEHSGDHSLGDGGDFH